jgi:DsbC/DsbD-like thiol-disulfide interchange protein
LLNTHLDEQLAHYGVSGNEKMRGVPYPGAFFLDENGVVVDKRFEQSYRVRPTAASLLESIVGEESTPRGASAEFSNGQVSIAAWTDSATYRPYQKLRLHLALNVGPSLHLYGDPAPEGTSALAVSVDPLETLEAGPLEIPAAATFEDESTGERYAAYEGEIRGGLWFELNRNLGEVDLVARVRFQVCGAGLCYPPVRAILSLHLTGLDNA